MPTDVPPAAALALAVATLAVITTTGAVIHDALDALARHALARLERRHHE